MNKSLAIIGVGYVGLPLAMSSVKKESKVFDPLKIEFRASKRL